MKRILYALCAGGILTLASCSKDTSTTINNLLHQFGWLGTDDPSKIPSSISPKQFGNTTVPSAVNLVPKFPPIGDQGQYGTCVAWASGYNLKTAIEGMDAGRQTADLAQTNNQMSPKDLFLAIDDNKKGASDCNGTNLQYALDVMLNRGVASLQTVPYSLNGGCSQANSQSGWAADAANHKIKNYRKIAVDKQEIKGYLANNQPVLIGAKLSDAFMTWNSDDVMMGNTTYDRVGQHAYHALVIGGYDDAKGPNGAFKIINSWSPNWGDNGYIWIDQNFAVNAFIADGNCYVATNQSGGNTPPSPDPVQNGNADLATWVFSDNPSSGGPTERVIDFDIYNIGTQSVSPSTNWGVYYIIYDAYNANNYGLLFADEASTTAVAAGTYGNCHINTNNVAECDFNATLPGANNLGNVLFGSGYNLERTYYIDPSISGTFYLLMYADPMNVIGEQDETNNLFYTTSQYPVTISNGVVMKRDASEETQTLSGMHFNNPLQPNHDNLKKNNYQTAVNATHRNAYSPEEIKAFLREEIKSGRFGNKVRQFWNVQNAGKVNK
ncbi:MAG: C1 family peptidase [Chitinophagales bacterium]